MAVYTKHVRRFPLNVTAKFYEVRDKAQQVWTEKNQWRWFETPYGVMEFLGVDGDEIVAIPQGARFISFNEEVPVYSVISDAYFVEVVGFNPQKHRVRVYAGEEFTTYWDI